MRLIHLEMQNTNHVFIVELTLHFIIDLLMESSPIIGQYQFEVFTKTFTLSLLIIVG